MDRPSDVHGLAGRMKQAEPKLPRGPQLFTGWRHVDCGMVPWERAGLPVGIWQAPPAATPGPTGPWGLRLEPQKPRLLGPLSDMGLPWETNYNMYFATVLRENGRYRAWYSCVPENDVHAETGEPLICHGHCLCYMESEDGFCWHKPELDVYRYEGRPSNIVFGRELYPYGYQSGSVFYDPHADAESRYKLIYLGVIPLEEPPEAAKARFRARFGDAMDERIFRLQDGKLTATCICGAVSADGIHWQPAEAPLLAYCSDTLNTCRWDEDLQTYVAYLRMWREGKRAVGRAESKDFFRWTSPARVVLEADYSWNPCIDVYTNSRVSYPGSDERLMFPGVYNRFEDRRSVYMAASEDEYSWCWLPGGAVADCGSAGDWTLGDLNPGTGMVLLGEDLAALPVMASEEPHKYPRAGARSLGKPGWLAWPRGRLCAVAADQQGEFVTKPMICPGGDLWLNFETVPRVGQILIRLEDPAGNALPGLDFDEAVPLEGDSLNKRAVWRSGSSPETLKGRPLRLHLRLRCAKLYSYEFKQKSFKEQ